MGIPELALTAVGRLVSDRRNRPSLVLSVSAARAIDDRPGLLITVVNPGPGPVVLKSVGVGLRGAGFFGGDVMTNRLEPADETYAWVSLRQLADRSGLDDPVTPIQSIFAVTTLGSARRAVDAKELLAELAQLYPAS